MRISDWSSDVCSSDLLVGVRPQNDGYTTDRRTQGGPDRPGDERLSPEIGEQLYTVKACGGPCGQHDAMTTSVGVRLRHELLASFHAPARSEERRVGNEWVST